ncbi:MAG: DUF4157 domain-containing protein, partial [Nannocystaceae bacterium]
MGSRIQRRQVGSEPSRTLGRVAPEVEASITSARGLGKGLEPSLQSKLEHGFNRDLSGVRVHTGPRADRLNHALYARAFTVGNDMFFRGGMFRPNSRSGQELIAHEVTHTLQQTSGPPVIQRFIYGGDDPHDLKQRKDPKHVYTLLVGTYGMDPLSAKNLIKTYGDVNRGPSIRLADLIRAYRKPKSKEEIEVKPSEKKKRRKPRRKKSKLELGHKDKQLKKKLPSKLEEPKEKEKEEDKLVSEPPKHKQPKLPTRNEVIEALKTGKPLSTSSENAKNLFSIQVRGANFVVKYEKKFGGLREALPAILAKEFGLGDYYVDSVSYVAPDNERDMVVMPFVTAKTGLGP